MLYLSLADPGGRRGARPPNRINFFRFHICFRQKVYVLEVGAPPPQRVGAPPTGNPGSATAFDVYCLYLNVYVTEKWTRKMNMITGTAMLVSKLVS